MAAIVVACGRTGLLIEDGELSDAAKADDPKLEASSDTQIPLKDAALKDAAPIPSCEPSEEICNGKDDDCDKQIDEVPAIPCPGGGSRYCVTGRLSDCPRRCEVCMPGSERICFISYCTYWAIQTCTADGRSFGPCREQRAPSECYDLAMKKKDSRELEQCCIDNGYCCLDEFDLDHDGNTGEMLGHCSNVQCGP